MTRFYLASQSPRRRELLTHLGIDFNTLDIEIDETWNGIESPQNYVLRIAKEKAIRAQEVVNDIHSIILTADTTVVLNNEILGKPRNSGEAIKMLLRLSGQAHQVFTALALCEREVKTIINKNTVRFRTLTIEEIESYVQTGEPMDKAGAYAIQGRAASFIIELEGSYSGVMGLPLKDTSHLLDKDSFTI
jgi:septum formation protein